MDMSKWTEYRREKTVHDNKFGYTVSYEKEGGGNITMFEPLEMEKQNGKKDKL